MPALTGFQKTLWVSVFSASLRLSQLFLHAAAETFGADDGAFVQAAHVAAGCG
jgi:hypothetical protein